MLQLLKDNHRYKETIFLGSISLMCFSFSIIRTLYSHTEMFLFLNWNLFLAFIPWVFTSIVVTRPRIQNSKIKMLLVLVTWLLFFPNAPYILTDLFHLKSDSTMPIWFDLILILSFAWVGLFFGFLSLWDIERITKNHIGVTFSKMLSAGLLFIAGFGIYIGRYLRWNSWDIVSSPFNLISEVGSHIIFPFQHPTTWGLTLFMGAFLNIAYWSFRFIGNRK